MTIDFTEVQNKKFVDIPNSEPKIKIRIPNVGISNRPTIIKIKDPLSGQIMHSSANLRISCSLEKSKRGLHMSRIEEAMDEIKEAGLSLPEFTEQLADLVLKTQDQESCTIEIDTQTENRVNKNKSGKGSTELIKLHSKIKILNGKKNVQCGVTVPFMNACPCTQRWAMRDFYNLLSAKGCTKELTEELVNSAPLQAHTNGGLATLKICDPNVSHSDLYEILNSSVPIVREMLKGIDEHTFVTMTHKEGQFCEDNVRTIASKTIQSLADKINPDARIQIHVEVNESVHFHNLWAEFDNSLRELQALCS